MDSDLSYDSSTSPYHCDDEEMSANTLTPSRHSATLNLKPIFQDMTLIPQQLPHVQEQYNDNYEADEESSYETPLETIREKDNKNISDNDDETSMQTDIISHEENV